ncbi:MAG: cardiolipin synthase [Clostridia bacterium]|nr:cardiolipin synthase [Clostridia bacterium]
MFTPIAIVVTVLNFLAIIAMIFIERKKPEIIISWLLLFSLFPILGFVFYVLIGSGLSVKTKKMLRRKKFYNDNYVNYYHQLINNERDIKNQKAYELVKYNMLAAASVPTFGNSVKIFTNGYDKIDALVQDIQNAKHSINIEYYIIGDDAIGRRVMDALIQKAKQGVAVNLIYDSVGSLKTKRKFFRPLKAAGGHVKEFFPPLFYIRLINLKMNYRNHRKIVVIDGKIGYVGGINIRADHCGENPCLSPWQDTHIRVEGQAVYTLQNEFLNFWQFCNKENIETNKYIELGYFPDIGKVGETAIQTITSGPDETKHEIKQNMLKIFQVAKEEVIIETPYFVPDEIFMNSIKMAIQSGVKFKLIIPGKPDKKFVYHATLSFAKEFVDMGGELYIFNGFMHAKTLTVDDFALTIGTANADNRSFSLNFEINAVLYDAALNKEYRTHLEEVMKCSKKVDAEYFKQKSWWVKFKQLFFRLFAPLF